MRCQARWTEISCSAKNECAKCDCEGSHCITYETVKIIDTDIIEYTGYLSNGGTAYYHDITVSKRRKINLVEDYYGCDCDVGFAYIDYLIIDGETIVDNREKVEKQEADSK